ncbi:MAG TPA: ABC transporter permease [Candidatus Saccharimonadales bacterium]
MLSTTGRVLRQLRHDHRTLGLVFFMPTVLLTVLYYVFQGNHMVFDGIAPLLLGIIPFTLMFIVASVAVLRERTAGTLERLLTSPASKLDILLGYAFAFALLALVQASIASFVTLSFLSVAIAGSAVSLLVVAMLSGVLGMAFGLLFSAFAKNEFQAVQFMPAFVLPQFLACGLFTPREKMAEALQVFSDVMPLTYVVKALQEVGSAASWASDLTVNVLVISGFIVVALLLGAFSLRSK